MTPSLSTPGFGNLWLWSDADGYKARGRDYRAAVVRDYPCGVCGVGAGELCVRESLSGPVVRRLPHVGRGL